MTTTFDAKSDVGLKRLGFLMKGWKDSREGYIVSWSFFWGVGGGEGKGGEGIRGGEGRGEVEGEGEGEGERGRRGRRERRGVGNEGRREVEGEGEGEKEEKEERQRERDIVGGFLELVSIVVLLQKRDIKREMEISHSISPSCELRACTLFPSFLPFRLHLTSFLYRSPQFLFPLPSFSVFLYSSPLVPLIL